VIRSAELTCNQASLNLYARVVSDATWTTQRSKSMRERKLHMYACKKCALKTLTLESQTASVILRSNTSPNSYPNEHEGRGNSGYSRGPSEKSSRKMRLLLFSPTEQFTMRSCLALIGPRRPRLRGSRLTLSRRKAG
jgi:hypothetical protein